MLVRKFDVSFREAHTVVGKIVSKAIKSGITSKHIDSSLVNKTAFEVLKIKLNLNDKDLIDSLDPKKIVAARKHVGGSCQFQMKLSIKNAKKHHKSKLKQLKLQEDKLLDADNYMNSLINKFIKM
jgi:argininosuccinate lyase